jgi:perosamine synthetase
VLALRNFGEKPPTRTRTYIAHRPAGNARLGPVEAAFTRRQLTRLPAYTAERDRVVTAFLDRLRGLPGLRVPHVPEGRTHVWHILRFRLVPEEIGLGGVPLAVVRTTLHRVLRAEGVPVSQYQVAPLPAHPAFRGDRSLDEIAETFPVACDTVDGSLCLQRRQLGPGSGPLLDAYADAVEKVWTQLDVVRQIASSRATPQDWRRALREEA